NRVAVLVGIRARLHRLGGEGRGEDGDDEKDSADDRECDPILLHQARWQIRHGHPDDGSMTTEDTRTGFFSSPVPPVAVLLTVTAMVTRLASCVPGMSGSSIHVT